MKHRLSVMVVVVAALVVVLGRGTALTGPAENRSYVRPSLPGADGPPFSGAVKVGNTLYLSGDIGLTEDQKVPGDAKAEARLLLDRVKRTLAEAGFTMEDLVTVTVFCSDVKHYADWNEVYRGYFKQEFPARAFIGSGRLLFDARFEMQGIAVKR
jgi:2-iminobutanoate/2-iminopropanoate deaminase